MNRDGNNTFNLLLNKKQICLYAVGKSVNHSVKYVVTCNSNLKALCLVTPNLGCEKGFSSCEINKRNEGRNNFRFSVNADNFEQNNPFQTFYGR